MRRSGIKRGIKWDEQPLGALPDGVLAKMHDVSVENVRVARERRGIPLCPAPRENRVPPPQSDPYPIAWHEMPLGEMTDTALAEMLGVSQHLVWAHRVERGIPACIEHAPFRPPSRKCVHCGERVPKDRRSFCSDGCKKKHHNDQRYLNPGSRPFLQGREFGTRRLRSDALQSDRPIPRTDLAREP